jgi:SAM-dependent methyltransferase
MTDAAFDGAADSYDDDFTRSRVGRAQRNLVWSHLEPVLNALGRPADVLEINCGTGEDAVHLAARGYQVLATDISTGMLVQTARKAARAGLGHLVQTTRLAAEMLSPALLGRQFDLVLSNFGGLNCLSPDDLAALAGRLAGIVRPGGRVVLVVMPPLCLWEVAWHLPRLHPRAAFRRLGGGPVTARVGAASFPIWYYGPDRLRRMFAADFDCVAVRPIGLAVPPSALEPAFTNRPALVDRLERLDRALPGWPLLAGISDHMLLEFRRQG